MPQVFPGAPPELFCVTLVAQAEVTQYWENGFNVMANWCMINMAVASCAGI